MLTLKKNETVSLLKPAQIVAIARWKDKPGGLFGMGSRVLDYDLFCHIAYRDGRREVVRYDHLDSQDKAVHHHGDLKAGGEERITVQLNEDIAAVGFSLYSALENGVGSFKHANAEVELEAGEEHVRIPTEGMSGNDNSYTLYFGTVISQDNKIEIKATADFSRAGSEKQAVLESDGSHRMDAGPSNQFK